MGIYLTTVAFFVSLIIAVILFNQRIIKEKKDKLENFEKLKYENKERVNQLVEDGYLEKSIRSGGWCEYSFDPYPPLKGYKLTEKAKSTELYSLIKKKEEKAIKQAFGFPE